MSAAPDFAGSALADGTVLAVEVERSSGFPLLDEAAVKAVHDASPVPPFPAAYRAERGTMVVPALYRLGVFKSAFEHLPDVGASATSATYELAPLLRLQSDALQPRE